MTNTNAADPLSRMAINSDGTVGIGTDSPDQKLQIDSGIDKKKLKGTKKKPIVSRMTGGQIIAAIYD